MKEWGIIATVREKLLRYQVKEKEKKGGTAKRGSQPKI